MLVLDLDQFISEPRTIKLKGKEFDLTEIPFELSLQVYDILPILTNIESSLKLSKEDYEKIFSLIYSIFKISEPELEEIWLRKLLTARRFNEVVPFVFQAMFDDGKKKESMTKMTTETESNLSPN